MPAFSAAGRAAARLLRPRRATPGGGLWKKAALRAGRHLLGHVGEVLRRLGLQVSAVLYLIFAAGFAVDGYHGWTHDHLAVSRHASSYGALSTMSGHTELLLGLALVFLYFGVSSLARAQTGKPRA